MKGFFRRGVSYLLKKSPDLEKSENDLIFAKKLNEKNDNDQKIDKLIEYYLNIINKKKKIENEKQRKQLAGMFDQRKKKNKK